MSDRKPELARMLELYRQAKAPQPDARERVWQAVEHGTAAGPQGSSAPSKSGTLKLVLLAGAFVGLGGLWLATREPVPASERTQAHEVEQHEVAARAAPTPAPAKLPPLPPPPEAMPEARAVDALAPSGTPEPRSRAVSRSSGVRAPASSLAEELKLLTAAQHASQRGKAREALALLADHARRFPDGAMAEEREAERVAALCALGRVDRAQRVAQTFLARFAGSPQSARVSRACQPPGASP